MKIRFSKTLAAVLAAASLVAMTGVTAFAKIQTVTTTTTYDWNATAEGDAADAEATVKVTSVVTGQLGDVNNEKQVTYLVSSVDDEGNRTINFIDQKPFTGDAKTAVFEFTALQSAIYNGEVTAQFGTDTTLATGVTMPAFKFVDKLDYFENGTADATIITENVPEFPGDFAVAEDAVKIWGQLSGNCTEGYGAEIKYGGETYELPAYGSIGGVFCVIVNADGDFEYDVYAR